MSVGDRIPLAIAAIVLSVFALSAGDAIIKFFSTDFPIWQLFVYRSALVIPILILLILRSSVRFSFRAVFNPWVLLRSALLVSMWIAYYIALPSIDLSLAAAAYYTAPLWITVLSMRVSGEKVTATVVFAVILGFVGALVLLKPSETSISVYLVLPFLAAIFYALAMVLTRTRCKEVNALVLSLALNLSFVVVGLIATEFRDLIALTPNDAAENPFMWGEWAAVGFTEMVVMVALAIAMLVGSVFAAIAYQSGPPALIAIFDYLYLVFATLWGFIVFTETPDWVTILGMLLIVAGGLIATHVQSRQFDTGQR